MFLFVEKMAGNKMAFFDLFQLRSLALTFLGSVFAAACETTARSAVDGASHLAFQRKHFFAALQLRIGDRDGRKKSFRVRMLRISVKLVTGSQLHDMSHIHNADTVGNMFYHGKVMGDEEVGQTQLFLKLDQQVDDLCLNGHVQSGDRLVTDDKFRIHSQSSRDTDTLSLSAGELVGSLQLTRVFRSSLFTTSPR